MAAHKPTLGRQLRAAFAGWPYKNPVPVVAKFLEFSLHWGIAYQRARAHRPQPGRLAVAFAVEGAKRGSSGDHHLATTQGCVGEALRA